MRTLLFDGFCFTFVQVCRVKVTPRLEKFESEPSYERQHFETFCCEPSATTLSLHVFGHVTSKHQLPLWINVALVSPEGSEAAGDVSTQHWTGERPARHMTRLRRQLPSSFSHFHSLTFCWCKSHEFSLFKSVFQTEPNSFELQSNRWSVSDICLFTLQIK